MERHRTQNYTSLDIEVLRDMPWEYVDQDKSSRVDIPDEFRGVTRYVCGAYTKDVTDYGGPFGSRTVYRAI